jgi:hypothetical protein
VVYVATSLCVYTASMQYVDFSYQGLSYKGEIVSDPSENPGYCWVVFPDPVLTNLLGDSVAFHFYKGGLQTVYPQHSHSELLEQLRKQVEAVVCRQ